jgi:hypothetical protein
MARKVGRSLAYKGKESWSVYVNYKVGNDARESQKL